MKKQLTSFGLSVIFILSLSLVQAQNTEKGNRYQKHEKGHHGMMYGKLLTEEQKESFKDIRLQSMKESKPIRDELRELAARHKTLMTADQPDMDKIYASIDKMSDLKSELGKIKAKARIEMSSQLTDEQKLKMESFKKKKKHHRGHSFEGKSFRN